MPARHRRAQRAPSSDHIEEEEDISHRRADDVDNDDDSDDVQPVRTKVKKEKKPRVTRENKDRAPVAGPSNAKNGNNNNDGGDEEEEDEQIDVENFRDQPLDRKDGPKLHGIAQDWEMIRKQIHQSSFRLVKDVAISLADVLEVDKADKSLGEADAVMKKLLDIDQEMRAHEVTLNSFHQALMRGEVVENVIDRHESEVNRLVDEYNSKTTRQKYASEDTYVEFKQGIYEVQHPGEAIPPISDFVPKEDGDPSDDEDELEVGGVTQDYKCPITLVLLKDPMTSKVCGHSYSRAAIEDFLRGAGSGGMTCPASGCRKKITMDLLKADKELEKRIKIAERRQRRREESEDDDDDNVIE